MWEFTPLSLKGACLIKLPKFDDHRGSFIKTFQSSVFEKNGIEFNCAESFFSISNQNVIRGMHFQIPPYDHSKIVFCPQGAILDVIVDLRGDSPTFGQYEAHILSADNCNAFFIPQGFAHGFKSLQDNTITYYMVSSEHNVTADSGILYNSFGMNWGDEEFIVSDRDKNFSSLANFNTPF